MWVRNVYGYIRFLCLYRVENEKNVSKYRWKICIIQFACNFLCTEVQHDLIIFQSKNSMLNGQNNYWNVLRWLICTNLWFYIFGFRINPTDYLFVYWKKKKWYFNWNLETRTRKQNNVQNFNNNNGFYFWPFLVRFKFGKALYELVKNGHFLSLKT